MCWFGQRCYEIPCHPLPYVRTDLHRRREDHGKHGHGEAQHIEKGDGSKGLLCIQNIVLIHQHVDSKAGQGDLGQIAGKVIISVIVCSPAPHAPLRPQQCLSAWDLFLYRFPSLGPISPLLWDSFPTMALLPAARTIPPPWTQPNPSSEDGTVLPRPTGAHQERGTREHEDRDCLQVAEVCQVLELACPDIIDPLLK